MTQSAARVLQLLELLQRQSAISGAALADELGIDRRTVRRHIAQLEALGVPVVGIRGRDGGYALLKGFRLPPMMFTNDEAMALVIGLRVAWQYGLVNTQAASTTALAKIERVLPAHARRQMRAIERAIAIPERVGTDSTEPDLLATLGAAVDKQQRVRLIHVRNDTSPTERDFDPYGLAHLDGHWYAVGFCHLRQDMRSFRLDRVRAVSLMPVSFGRDHGFDALGFLRQSIRDLPRSHQFEVFVRGDVTRVQRIVPPMLGNLRACNGGTFLKGQADDLDWVVRELSRLPFPVDIRKPRALDQVWHSHIARLTSREVRDKG